MNNHYGLVPLFNFGEVIENRLFRAGQPAHDYQYNWMKDKFNLGLDVIINLRAEKPTIDEGHGIETMTYMVVDHKPPTDEQALDFMVTVRNLLRQGKRVLIHCEHGHGRTSTFSVLAKMAMGWSLEDALKDEHERFHINFNHPAQEEWLEGFAKRTGWQIGRGERGDSPMG